MSPPAAIIGMRQAAHDVGVYPIAFANPQGGGGGRAQMTRTFHTYLEIGMQSKHCELMRGYCRQQNVEGTQVRHAQVAQSVLGVGGLYRQCAQTPATVAKDHMVARWSRPQQPGAQVFTGRRAGVRRRADASAAGRLPLRGLILVRRRGHLRTLSLLSQPMKPIAH